MLMYRPLRTSRVEGQVELDVTAIAQTVEPSIKQEQMRHILRYIIGSSS